MARNRAVRGGCTVKYVVPVVCAMLCVAVEAGRQEGLDPRTLGQPPTGAWPTYNGDYSGRRFSMLAKINDRNVTSLSLAWVYRVNAGGTPGGGTIKSTPLQVNGVLYVTVP